MKIPQLLCFGFKSNSLFETSLKCVLIYQTPFFILFFFLSAGLDFCLKAFLKSISVTK